MEPVTPSCQKPVLVLVEPPKPTQILSTESIQMEPLESEEAPRMIQTSSRKKADLDTALKERIDRFEKLKEDVLDLEKHLHQFYNMRLPMIRTGRRRIRRKAHEIVRRFPVPLD